MFKQSILIYGANGYTGRQLASYLINRGIRPVFGPVDTNGIAPAGKHFFD
ncbi:hypothetical protein [Agarilytica rhodophyticola]|nr:hypothetical protein [Agarilytica rhodophyticola]